MNKTNDFKYNLPAYSDPVDIEDLNDNFRGIDDALMAGLCKKDYTGNNMGSSDPSQRKYAWAPWLEIVNDNEFDVVVTDRNAPVESEEATINIAAGQTVRKYINGRYYMNFYVQDQYDVTFKWFTDAETYINESGGGGGGTGTVTSVSVQGASGSHISTSGSPIETSGTISIGLESGYSIPQTSKQTAWDGKAADLKAEIDSSTYVMTLQLKDSSGTLIGNERTIDLPLETMVVDGEYDTQTQKIKLELKNGNYVEFSVADLVSGLQTELSASNKLDPDYIDYDASHRAVSDTEKDTWNAKQNAISDLATIRSGAAAGATAVQPSALETALAGKQDTISDLAAIRSGATAGATAVQPATMQTALDGKQNSLNTAQLAAVNSGIDSDDVAQISTNQTNILYAAETGVKNRIILNDTFSIAPPETIGLTVTNNGDGTITVSGTPTSTNADQYVYITIGKFYYSADKYRIEQEKIGSNGYYFTNDNHLNSNAGGEYTYTSAGSTNVVIRLQKNTTYSSQIVYPMIRPTFITDTTFQPGAKPNYDLTRLEAEDRASLAEVVDSGAKNILDFANLTFQTQAGTTYTKTDTDITVASTGTSTWAACTYKMSLSAGNYVFSAKISNLSIGSGGVAKICLDTQADGHGTRAATLAVEQNGTVSKPFTWGGGTLYIMYYPNYSGNLVVTTFKASENMICTKAAFGVSQKFVPYKATNYYLSDTQSCRTTYTLAPISVKADANRIIRITARCVHSNSMCTGIILSRNNLPSYYNNAANLVGRIEADYDNRELNLSCIVPAGNTTIYMWTKFDADADNMVQLYVEYLT